MSDTRWSGEARYRALLAVSEAANSSLDLSRALDALASALESLVPIDGIGVITSDGETFRTLGVHAPMAPRGEDEPHQDYLRRIAELAHPEPGRWTAPSPLLRQVEQLRRPVTFEDIQHDPRFRDTSLLKRSGFQCLTAAPLLMGARFVGGITFGRLRRCPFTPEELTILEDVSKPVASAVANALAFEQIAALQARLVDENLALKEEISLSSAAGGIIGASPALRAALERVERVAATGSTVLISGETGSGKELVARAIHNSSPRARGAFVKVNCAALAEALVASELFGHEKGAFTGALERRRGRFELANGGTILLDEVGEVPPSVQTALLRVLQDGEFERVGGNTTLHTDARVVAATNRDLERAVAEGCFRSDLFFRLNVFPIRVPALRERLEDVPLLAEYYAHHYARKIGKAVRGVSREAMALLCGYSWPGNVRELQNVIERAVILAGHELLQEKDLELTRLRSEPPAAPAAAPDDDDAERRRIEQALAASRGRVSGPRGAATALGVPASTLEARIRRLGIDKLAYRPRARRDGA